MLIWTIGFLSAVAAFSASEATIGWQLTNAAYCSTDSIVSWSCPNCGNSGVSLSDVSVFSSGGSKVFTGYDSASKKIIVSFMGSSNIQNWINNLNTVKTSYPYCSGCQVHTGFYKSYLEVALSVRTEVTSLKSKYSAGIRIYGHSLGGAQAVHAAADLHQQGISTEFVYTFGQPRVGDPAFASWYKSIIPQHFRVTHGRDIVPHLPPVTGFGFGHTPLEVFYPNNPPTYTVCDGSGEDPKCSNSVILALSIIDHLTYMGGSCCCDSLQNETKPASGAEFDGSTSIAEKEAEAEAQGVAQLEAACSGLGDCGSCLGNSVLGLGQCSWCTFQGACHAVGSIYNPCPSSSCVSSNPLSQCSLGTCPAISTNATAFR